MSESDSFIQEVSEEIRQDRMFALWKRYGPVVIGAIIAIVGAAAIWNWLEHRAVLEARETGGRFIEAELAEVEAQEALLEDVDDEAEVVAEFRLASSLLMNDQPRRAAAIYATIAERQGLAPEYRHLAKLQALKLASDDADPVALVGELDALAAPEAPYQPLALELRGVLHLEAGDAAAAREDFQAALDAPRSTAETRRRVAELLAALGQAAASE